MFFTYIYINFIDLYIFLSAHTSSDVIHCQYYINVPYVPFKQNVCMRGSSKFFNGEGERLMDNFVCEEGVWRLFSVKLLCEIKNGFFFQGVRIPTLPSSPQDGFRWIRKLNLHTRRSRTRSDIIIYVMLLNWLGVSEEIWNNV